MNMNDRLHQLFPKFPADFPLPFILDGSTGSALMKLGMPAGACTELYVMENPDKIAKIQSAYAKSGANAVFAPTFGANSAVLKRHYVDVSRVEEINKALVSISKKARCSCGNCAGGESQNVGKHDLKIGADISPTGLFIEPYGDTPFETVVDIYREQAQAILESGVDFFITETNISLAEARAAVIAVRELSVTIPVFVTLTVDKNGRTMSGDSLTSAVLALSELGINAIGANCSTGPDEMIKALAPVVPYAASLGIPVIAKPNAGMPTQNEDGTQSFSLTADDMEQYIPEFFANGIFVLGGCCGTDDKYIAKLRQHADAAADIAEIAHVNVDAMIATNRDVVDISDVDIAECEFIAADDELTDNVMECEDDFICIDLGADGAGYFIEAAPFMTIPVIAKGEKSQTDKIKRTYNGKIKFI
jgi:Methionine synthase I (cobalamin-dependent), methyltransferase domain